jgi:hypothetical protein
MRPGYVTRILRFVFDFRSKTMCCIDRKWGFTRKINDYDVLMSLSDTSDELATRNGNVQSKEFCKRMVLALPATLPSQWRRWKKPMMLRRMDNPIPPRSKMTVQRMAELRITSAPSLPFSLDIVPSHFYLFGHFRDQLWEKGYHNEREVDRSQK